MTSQFAPRRRRHVAAGRYAAGIDRRQRGIQAASACGAVCHGSCGEQPSSGRSSTVLPQERRSPYPRPESPSLHHAVPGAAPLPYVRSTVRLVAAPIVQGDSHPLPLSRRSKTRRGGHAALSAAQPHQPKRQPQPGANSLRLGPEAPSERTACIMQRAPTKARFIRRARPLPRAALKPSPAALLRAELTAPTAIQPRCSLVLAAPAAPTATGRTVDS